MNITDPTGLSWYFNSSLGDSGTYRWYNDDQTPEDGFVSVVGSSGQAGSFVYQNATDNRWVSLNPYSNHYSQFDTQEAATSNFTGIYQCNCQGLVNTIAEQSETKGKVVGALAGGAVVVGATGGAALYAAPAILPATVTTLGLTETAAGVGTTTAAVVATHPDEAAQVVEATTMTVSQTASRLGHIFSSEAGHVQPITSASQGRFINLFERVANNPDNLNPNVLNNFQRANQGFQGFSQTFRNGQVWTQTFGGQIINAGVNRTPR